MRKDLVSLKPIYSSFLSCDDDIRQILRTLFITTKPHSDILKRLLVINNRDCLDTTKAEYQQIIDNMDLSVLIDRGYIRLNPKITRGSHEQIKSYIIISLDNFMTNAINSEYRDYNINFDIVCNNDAWVLNNYKIRPLAICGYIDGILNSVTEKNKRSLQSKIKITGIGRYDFLGCNEVVLNEDLSMYTLSYHGMHFSEDLAQIGKITNAN